MKTKALEPSRTLRTVLLAVFLMTAATILAPKPAEAGLRVRATIGSGGPRARVEFNNDCGYACCLPRSDRRVIVRTGGKHQRRVIKCETVKRKHRRHRHQRQHRQVWVPGYWEQVSRRTARWVPGHWERV